MFEHISLFDGAAWYLVFLFSTTVHEASHSLVALRLGDDTAHRGGQVTLDPIPHIRREPFGMVIIPILSYLFGGWMIGWASAPYDPLWARHYPKRAGLMAIAGPAANLLLVLVAAALIHLGIAFDVFTPSPSITSLHVVEATHSGFYLVGVLLSLLFSLNLLLFVFNLLPVPPLDGSSGLMLILSDSAARKYWEVMSSPGLSLLGFFVAWKAFGFIYPPVHLIALNLLYPGLHYM